MKYTYDGPDVALDEDGSGNQVEYGNGPGIDNKLWHTPSSGSSVFYLKDHLGSTRALASNTGSIITGSEVNYDSFGNATNQIATRFTYTGREYDPDAGLYYYRARWYDPQARRFISEDPIGLSGGINLYAYVGNNPVDLVDPTGLREALNIGAGYTAEVDIFNTGNISSHEIHIYNPKGNEIGVFGPTGWINKHGFTEAPDIPKDVYDKINGINIDQLRRAGRLPPKGQCDVKNGKYIEKVAEANKARVIEKAEGAKPSGAKTGGVISKGIMILQVIDIVISAYDLQKRADEHRIHWIQQYMADFYEAAGVRVIYPHYD
jgi:RHS repeat-associated protein